MASLLTVDVMNLLVRRSPYLPASLSCFVSVAASSMLMPEAGHATMHSHTEDMISQLACMMEELPHGHSMCGAATEAAPFFCCFMYRTNPYDWLCP